MFADLRELRMSQRYAAAYTQGNRKRRVSPWHRVREGEGGCVRERGTRRRCVQEFPGTRTDLSFFRFRYHSVLAFLCSSRFTIV